MHGTTIKIIIVWFVNPGFETLEFHTVRECFEWLRNYQLLKDSAPYGWLFCLLVGWLVIYLV
jgi:dolichyl-phosphate-mannose--protein O-mannosyl transferase